MEDLPKTFQHAVKITRDIGIRFLWIDSLCIVQDDPADWEIEASKMASIYSGSYLTIAAISSRDSRGGCIPELTPSEYFKIDGRGKGNTSIYVRQTPSQVHLRRAHLEITGGWNPLYIPLVSTLVIIIQTIRLLTYNNSYLELGSIKSVFYPHELLISTKRRYSGNVHPP